MIQTATAPMAGVSGATYLALWLNGESRIWLVACGTLHLKSQSDPNFLILRLAD